MNEFTQDRVDEAPLWPSRYLTDGRMVIGRPPVPAPAAPSSDWLLVAGRRWRRLSRRYQWIIVIVAAAVVGSPFHQISDDLGTAVSLIALAVAGLLIYASREEPPRVPAPQPVPPHVLLAAADSIESRVAAAATRAWAETEREPAWQSPYLARSGAAFDGQAEVDQIIALALRIHEVRWTLGAQPSGTAGEYWLQQHQALDNAARQLGRRADALIRYRDQTALLSTELRHLADLERLERTATQVDGLTIETAFPGSGPGDLRRVADDVAGVRAAMTELLELMMRTHAPLAAPPAVPPL